MASAQAISVSPATAQHRLHTAPRHDKPVILRSKVKKRLRVLDLFCGAGGTSHGTALELAARGYHIGTTPEESEVDLLAVNHWPKALDSHEANHPWARHTNARVQDFRPRDWFPKARVHLLIASPECTHFSTARGARPVNDQLRASIWEVPRIIGELDRVDTILIENVPEFKKYGPTRNGRPIKQGEGSYYKAVKETLRTMGYTVADAVLNSADYGDPTNRKRLYLIARLGKKPVHFPLPTHSQGGKIAGTKPWRTARDAIDWSIQGQDVLSRDPPLALNTLLRIARGCWEFNGLDISPYVEHVYGPEAGEQARPRGPPPAGTPFGRAFLLGQQSGGAPRPVDEPSPTVATAGAIGISEPFLVQSGGPAWAGGAPRGLSAPGPTVLTGDHLGMAEPFVLPLTGPYHLQGQNAPRSIDLPAPVVRAERGGGHIVQPFVVTTDRPLTNRSAPRGLEEPGPTVTGNPRIGLVEFITPNFGERPGQAPRVHRVDAPAPAVTGHGAGALVRPYLVKYHGSERGAHSVDEPASTVTTKPRLGLVVPVHDGLAIVGLRFRMLQPHELAAFQGFPKGYTFTGNRQEQIKQIGNAVSVNMARALVGSILDGRTRPVLDVFGDAPSAEA